MITCTLYLSHFNGVVIKYGIIMYIKCIDFFTLSTNMKINIYNINNIYIISMC